MLEQRLPVLLRVHHAHCGEAAPFARPRRLRALVHPRPEPPRRRLAGAAHVPRAQRRRLVAGEQRRRGGGPRERGQHAALEMDHVGREAIGDVTRERVEREQAIAGTAGPRVAPGAERHRLDARRALGQPGALRRRVAGARGGDHGDGVAIDEMVEHARHRETRGVVARQERQPWRHEQEPHGFTRRAPRPGGPGEPRRTRPRSSRTRTPRADRRACARRSSGPCSAGSAG